MTISQCSAKTRTGGSCGLYSMTNGHCRFHGGKSTGAKNPRVKHGMYRKSAIAERKWLNDLLKDADKLVSEI